MRALLLRLLKLDERPEPPAGAGGDLSIFRASPLYFWYSMLGWGLGQGTALFGILIPLGALDHMTVHAFNFHISGFAVPDLIANAEFEWEALGLDWTLRIGSLIQWLGILAITIFVIQLVVSFLLLRLAWEMRWYIVTDTALRIREGLLRTREQTLTIAKIQNLRTRQGPVQRLFGIADLEVQTAGGGGSGSSDSDKDGKSSARLGRFRGIDNVGALRDRLRRLQGRQRGSGVDDREIARDGTPGGSAALAPIVERMLAEARGIRTALESRGGST